MKHIPTLFKSTLLLCTLCCWLQSCIREDSDGPDKIINHINTGDKVPAFTVNDGSGNDFQSAGFQDKKSLLVLFSTTCGDCKRELPKAEAVWQALQSDPLYQVITIARQQGKEETDKYWKDKGFTMPKYLDPERFIFNLFANSTIPRFYIVDSQGIVQWMGVEDINLSSDDLIEKIKSLP